MTVQIESIAGSSRRVSKSAAEDRVVEQIREAVLDHRLAPGAKLKEVALADVFGVTRNVVRKALARLASDRLVELQPNRGARVANPTAAEGRDLYAARHVIEAALIERLARAITPVQLRQLRGLVKQERDAYRRGEMRQGLQRSIEFHRLIGHMAGNSVLADMLDQILLRTPLVVVAYQTARADSCCANGEHDDIIGALAKGNAEAAVRAVRKHLKTLESQLDLAEREPAGADLATVFTGALGARAAGIARRQPQPS